MILEGTFDVIMEPLRIKMGSKVNKEKKRRSDSEVERRKLNALESNLKAKKRLAMAKKVKSSETNVVT